MSTAVKIEPKDVDQIPFQEASLDIWEKKYRLVSKSGEAVDKTMDDTYKRVARALADVEAPAEREPVAKKAVAKRVAAPRPAPVTDEEPSA